MHPACPPSLLVAVLAALASGCHLAPTRHGRVGGELAGSTLLVAQSTGSREEPATLPPARDPNALLPEWVVDPSPGDIAGAVGVAAQRERGIREQLEEARLSGRMELASMFEVRLQRVGRSETEENDRPAGQGGQDRRRNLVTVDRDLVDVVMAGSRQRALWVHPESGDCYVWMVLDAKILDKAKQAIVEGVTVLDATDRAPHEPPYGPEKRPPEASPPNPETPPEKIEENLKPIRTIPL